MKHVGVRTTRPRRLPSKTQILPRAHRDEARRGAATVELALCLPLLATLALGICEVGQALKVEAVLSEAARKACSTACRPGCTNTDVTNDAKSVLSANRIPTGSVTVTIAVNDAAGNVAAAVRNDKITVTVKIPIAQVNWTNTSRYFGGTTHLSQTVVMARQG
jgi:Flp pilus assembly protein TadG